MTIGSSLVTSDVHSGRSILTVDVTGEVPIEEVTCASDSRLGRFGDNSKAVLIGYLEEERGIVSSEVPAASGKRVGISVKSSTGSRMFEVGEVVAEAMDDSGGVLDAANAVESCWRSPTHGLGEAEGQKTDTCHENKNDRDEAHLLSPSTLLLWTAEA